MKRILLILLLFAHSAFATDFEAVTNYVSRVGQTIQIVSDRPNLNYEFVVVDSEEPALGLDQAEGIISISHGLLLQLRDEAELAAILSLAISRLSDYINIDRESAKYMSFAGYDPHALLEIQEQYFHAVNASIPHWLQSIYPSPISAGTIAANRVMIEALPQGQRGAEDYYQQINN